MDRTSPVSGEVTGDRLAMATGGARLAEALMEVWDGGATVLEDCVLLNVCVCVCACVRVCVCACVRVCSPPTTARQRAGPPLTGTSHH
jgi:hypothetical protein